MKRTVIAVLAVPALAAAGLVLDMPPVSSAVQFDLALKILTFDRALPGRIGNDLVFGILYRSDEPISLRVKTEMEKVFAVRKNIRIGKIPVRPEAIALDRSSRWEKDLLEAGVDVVYLAPMPNPTLVRIIRLCRDLKITTIGSLPAYPSLGAVVGFEPDGDRARILINLTAARESGSDFNSRLLARAKLFR